MAHILYKRSVTSLTLLATIFLIAPSQMPARAQMLSENPEINPGDELIIIGGTIIGGDGTGGGTGAIVGPPGGTVATPTPTPTATATDTPAPYDTPVDTPTPVPGSYDILPPTNEHCQFGGTWTCGLVSECCVDTDGKPLVCCVNSGF